ncbi:MAG: hypothetical protein PHD81_03330 [Candidatus Nanoarchaeia archaeon]|nr:hypothetical protein [Candidatus Nanoarchaeia archaeon]MDD5588117.1 hypothetical protein [Candidatus Nanoarchaeia archaeon]
MKLSEIKPEHLDEILDIYTKIFQPGLHPKEIHYNGKRLYEDFQKALAGNQMELFLIEEGYRLGSKWTGHSKLKFRIHNETITAIFYPNLLREEKGHKQAEKAGKLFTETVEKYLNSTNS